jgi:hypothetical protein
LVCGSFSAAFLFDTVVHGIVCHSGPISWPPLFGLTGMMFTSMQLAVLMPKWRQGRYKLYKDPALLRFEGEQEVLLLRNHAAKQP